MLRPKGQGQQLTDEWKPDCFASRQRY